ncbi:MAG: transposase [Sphingobacteriales bacterium]|nr:transposase [Sphingobacteriales bacterium]
MEYIKGIPREQAVLFTDCLDNIIASDNEVRLIDMFVESIEMEKFGFASKLNAEGRPAYNPKDLLKLFIYGYLNCIRSSRVLEKECRRNTEVMWLLQQLAPDHNTIANFRKDNQKAIRGSISAHRAHSKTISINRGQTHCRRLDQTSGSKQQEKQF